ncbi:MAG: hypothetical protein C4K58_04520 [Flavobacteriaceae bacterium]|nr:MAG: hypothetical protein C4K58_04520 [Flavobacteriaceae bacterium]
MKTFKTIALTLALTLFGTVSAFAQKVGHVNVDKILTEMPDRIAAEKTLESFALKHKTQIENDQIALEKKYNEFKAQAAGKTDEQLMQMQQQLQKMQQDIMQYEQTATNEVNKKQMELFEPLQKKIKDAITLTASEKGLDYVLDSSSSTVLVAKGTDITADVQKKLK